MRSFRLALVSVLVGTAACSLLLDTDALQNRGQGGGGGAAGGGIVDAGDLDAPREAGTSTSCNTDVDCQPLDSVDGCTRHSCGADKTCAAPAPYMGLAMVSVPGDAETAEQADDIGYPSMTVDGSDVVLGVWKRNGTTTNIVIRKYDERPEISPISADLNAISGNRFESIASSPGLAIRGIPRRIRLFAAAKPTGAAGTGMYQLEVDLANLRLSAMQPMRTDLGVTGYDTSPRGPAPRLLPGVGEPVGMWIQQGKLFYFDGNGAGEVFGAKRVLGFAPLAPTGQLGGGVHAALETVDMGGTENQAQTELWTRGSPSLAGLVNDQPGMRRGVATTATGEGLGTINFVVWSFERGGNPALYYAAASCDMSQCLGFGAPSGSDQVLPAVAPAVSSARVAGSVTDRDLAVTFQVSGPDPARPGMTSTAILGGVSRLTTNADASPALTAKPMNPANFVVAASNLPPANLGPISVAMTPGGSMMVAWVERGPNQAVLKTRRFRVKTCP